MPVAVTVSADGAPIVVAPVGNSDGAGFSDAELAVVHGAEVTMLNKSPAEQGA